MSPRSEPTLTPMERRALESVGRRLAEDPDFRRGFEALRAEYDRRRRRGKAAGTPSQAVAAVSTSSWLTVVRPP